MAQNNMSIREQILRRTVPVVINSYNQLFYLEAIVERLIREEFKNIYVLDQASAYPPLREWLAKLSDKYGVLPLYLSQNLGPWYFFQAKMYEMFGNGPLIYTDPDLSWEKLAPDFVSRLFDLSKQYQAHKVGAALILPQQSAMREGLGFTVNGVRYSVHEWESRFWANAIEPGVYDAQVDTTLHLFNPAYYREGADFFKGLRVAGEGYAVEHLPWYQENPVPAAELEFYSATTRNSSWIATA